MPHRRKVRRRGDLPLHVTLRLRRDRPRLRNGRALRVVERACWRLVERGVRLLAWGFGGDHFHLLVERGAVGEASLLKGFVSMVARGVNRLRGLHGRALGDRAHVRTLATPFEAWRALRYVLCQGVHHGYALHPEVDPYCSYGAVVERSGAYLARGRSWVWRKLGVWNEELWRIAHLVLARPREDADELAVLGIGPPSRRRGEGFAQRWAREGAMGAWEG